MDRTSWPGAGTLPCAPSYATNPAMPRSQRWFALALVVSAYLILQHLGTAWFWDDEAEVAVFARNFLQRGELTAWDGRNLFAYRDGTTTTPDLHSRQPPLMFYLTAASFRVFGESTWAGRLPHALLGIATVWLLGVLLRRELRDVPWAAAYGAATLGSCLSFVLAARQCRYFGACLCGVVVVYGCYSQWRDGARWRGAVGMALGATWLFFAHYLVAWVFLAALGVTYGLWDRRTWPRGSAPPLAVALTLWSLLTIPYSLRHAIWVRPDLQTGRGVAMGVGPSIVMHLRDLNRSNVLPAVAALGLVVLAVRVAAWRRPVGRFLTVALAYTVIMGAVTPQRLSPSGWADVRYLVGAVPFAAGAVAMGLAWLHHHTRRAAYAALLVLALTNAATWPGHFAYKFMLPRYLREIHRPYPTADEAAARTLLEVAKQDDAVLTVPSYEALPVLFYAGEHIKVCCTLSPQSPLATPWLRAQAPVAFRDTQAPDWILAFGQSQELSDTLTALMQRGRHSASPYTYRQVRRLGVYFRNTQRPEVLDRLSAHAFGPVKRYNTDTDDVYLYQREPLAVPSGETS